MSGKDMLNRRSALKGIGSAVAAVGLGTSVAGADGASTDTSTRDFNDHRNVVFGSDLKRLSRNWIFVAGPSERVYKYIGESDVDVEKQRSLKNAYKDIERQYPVVRRSIDDNTTQVALAGDAAEPDALGREAKSRLGEIATAVSQGSAAADSSDDSDVRADWYRKIHAQTAEIAANSNARHPDKATVMYDNGDDTPTAYYPDKRDTDVPDALKNTVAQGLAEFVANIVQSFLHYRNPDSPPFDFSSSNDGIPDEYVLNEGGIAHIMAQKEVDVATSRYDDQELTDAYKRLGYATHYLADITNPLHTGMELQQGSDYIATVINGGNPQKEALHYRHERHVNKKWSDWFKSRVEDEPSHFYGFDTVQSEVNSLAGETQDDASTVFYDVMFKSKDDWTSDLRDLNEDRLAQTVSYTKGLFEVME